MHFLKKSRVSKLTEQGAENAIEILKHTREELSRIETKTTVLVSALSVSFTVLVTVTLVIKTTPVSSFSIFSTFLWFIGLFLFFATLITLGAIIFPILTGKHVKKKNVISYYGHVYRQNQKMIIETLNKDIARDWVVEQLLELSIIVTRKYRLLRVALILFGIAFFMLILAFSIK